MKYTKLSVNNHNRSPKCEIIPTNIGTIFEYSTMIEIFYYEYSTMISHTFLKGQGENKMNGIYIYIYVYKTTFRTHLTSHSLFWIHHIYFNAT